MVAGLSLDSVAGVLGVCRSTVWRYLNGKSKPPRSVCVTLAYLSGRLPAPGWETCQINIPEQRLYVDDNRYGIHRKDLRLYFFQLQELRALRRYVVKPRASLGRPSGLTVSRSPYAVTAPRGAARSMGTGVAEVTRGRAQRALAPLTCYR